MSFYTELADELRLSGHTVEMCCNGAFRVDGRDVTAAVEHAYMTIGFDEAVEYLVGSET